MTRRRVFWFGYGVPVREGRDRDLLQMRDAMAALCLITALDEHGHKFEGPICNYPSPGPDFIAFNDVAFRDDDLILLATRPPLDDRDLPDRRGIARSFTTLEELLFRYPLRAHFTHCSPGSVRLTDETAAISTEIRKRQAMEYQLYGPASYRRCTSPGRGRSAVFLVYREHAWEGGPAFLAAFGMGSRYTLAWAELLRTRFKELLLTTPFAMAELQPGGPEEPPTLDFVDWWDAQLLGKAPAGREFGRTHTGLSFHDPASGVL